MNRRKIGTGLVIGATLMLSAGVYSRTFLQQRGAQPGVIKPEMADTITATVYADNWFAMYINGKLVAVDPIDFLPHNVVKVDFDNLKKLCLWMNENYERGYVSQKDFEIVKKYEKILKNKWKTFEVEDIGKQYFYDLTVENEH